MPIGIIEFISIFTKRTVASRLSKRYSLNPIRVLESGSEVTPTNKPSNATMGCDSLRIFSRAAASAA